jgi:hypothetical protein
MPRKKTSGYRDRFNFVLTDSDRDRVVAQWLNQQPNASEAIKTLIYATATGQQRQISSPQPLEGWADEEPQPVSLDDDDPRVRALRGAVDT